MKRAGKNATNAFRKGVHPSYVLESKLPKMKVGRIQVDSKSEPWQAERKSGTMDLTCAVFYGAALLGTLVYLAL